MNKTSELKIGLALVFFALAAFIYILYLNL